MEKDINSCFFRTLCVRLCVLFLLFVPLQARAIGWIPTDAGLVVKLQPENRIALSVVIDGKEYFVCHYNDYVGDKFGYNNNKDNNFGNYLKLIHPTSSTELPAGAVWTIDSALTRGHYPLGGISYTMWSDEHYTLFANDGWKFQGNLSDNEKDALLSDAVFVVPTIRANTDMDPRGTLNASHTAEGRNRGTGDKSWAFDGKTGVGFNDMVYREVYWFEIPRNNKPRVYENSALVAFNTTNGNMSVRNVTIPKGKAYWIYSDLNDPNKYTKLQRMLFRLYVLEKEPFNSCPDSYFYAWDEQDYVRYRSGDNEFESGSMSDSTAARKIYSTDHLYCMDSVPGTSIWKTSDLTYVPVSDSVYYYVGHKNRYRNAGAAFNLGAGSTAISNFTNIRELPVYGLSTTMKAPAGACGRMVVDTASSAENLGVSFEPAGYFLRVHTTDGKDLNIPMRQTGSYEWTSDQMWTIDESFVVNTIKAMIYTGPNFSPTDPGLDIEGWSNAVPGTSIKVHETGADVAGKSGWARIYTNNSEANGALDFVLANLEKHVTYNRNGHFGDDIPDQYPMTGATTVKVQAPRLLDGYAFTGWNTRADGSGVAFAVGETIDLDDLPDGAALVDNVLTLYAQAHYTGNIHVAISFMEGGERYFLTHPGSGTPRYARARHFTDWTDVYQGMSDAENSQPNYLTSYKLIGLKEGCKECETDEYILDSHRETMYGAVDSLQFYDKFSTNTEEFIGLYYNDPNNTVLANDTWAGLFQSTEGWPTPANACIDSTRLLSTYYLHEADNGEGGVDTVRTERPNSARPEIKYIAATNQFDGKATNAGTDFMLSGVGVVDAYYVILPDTTAVDAPWTDAVSFDALADIPAEQQVWSQLIGKQLLAQMKVGDDTVYFHPNRNKILTTANELRLSSDFRLTQSFSLIHDKRPTAPLEAGDSVTIEENHNGFGCLVTAGASAPIGVTNSSSQYIDIVDTLRVRLMPKGTSKIKAYYGRWHKDAEGLTVAADGTRYRDILITTKTYHYGDELTRLVLKPEQESYTFSALANQSKQLNFKLMKVTYRELLDVSGTKMGEEIVSTENVSSNLALTASHCSLGGSVDFTLVSESTNNYHVTLKTAGENAGDAKRATLTVTITSVTIDEVTYTDITVSVPLMQVSLAGSELIWSVVDGGKRYFIMAGTGGLIFRQYTLDGSTLYQLNKKGTHLIKGAANATNSDTRYITPWSYAYPDKASHPEQITLSVASPVSKSFVIDGSTPGIGDAASVLTYEMDTMYVNSNANYEERVRLKFGAPSEEKWLKFTGGGSPSLSLVDNRTDATVFSWSYMLQEYNLLNNGGWPDQESATFGYNSTAPTTIKTAFKAYREYSMLLTNSLTRLCREEETDLEDLTASGQDWKTSYTVSLLRDDRTFDTPAPEGSGLAKTPAESTFNSTITPSGTSPRDVKIGGKYVNIVDTLQVTPGLQGGAKEYRFQGDWSGFRSISEAALKIPLIRMTFHEAAFDSVLCTVDRDEYNYAFPSTVGEGGVSHTFDLKTTRRLGTNILDVDNNVVSSITTSTADLTAAMNLSNIELAEIRLIDEYGSNPTWCTITGKTASSVTVKCTASGVRSPRSAYLYFAYIVEYIEDETTVQRFVNFRLTVSQASHFDYANNQILIHSQGASGDPLLEDGRQQAHENKRILYYYNPKPYAEPDQNVELPVRERGYYGWWRWYREGKDQNDAEVGDTDIPDSVWQTPPRNVGAKNFPFRIIGDSVWIDDTNHSLGKKLVTMGRYTVFFYPAKTYTKADPPSKSPLVYPPFNKDTVTYVVDLSNYYDNLPLSTQNKNQIDTAMLDTLRQIIEPTLSLRESFELRPWTEMAARLEGYKDTIAKPKSKYRNLNFLEDHVVMAPAGKRLLLRTEQRYNYENLQAKGHSESLLGYYMRDDHWADGGWSSERKDTMIWCGGWDADCVWFIFHPADSSYSKCNYEVTVDEDFLSVPADAGKAGDTLILCLRA